MHNSSELESFAKFGTRLDEHTRKIIDHGERIRVNLKQAQLDPLSVPEQLVILMALTGGLLDSVPMAKMQDASSSVARSLPRIFRRQTCEYPSLARLLRDTI